MLDVFRLECGGVRWLGSVTTLEGAQARALQLAATPAAEYLVVDLKTGHRQIIKLGGTEKSADSRRAEAD